MSTAFHTRAAAAAADGRPAFVDYVLNDFVERTHITVRDEVRAFILGDVLHRDDVWLRGLRERSFDPDSTALILTEALDEAAKVQQVESELSIANVGTSEEGAFYTIIHRRWKCPFPFIFC
jgi:hypothetical protein